jgi:hypothetical protein
MRKMHHLMARPAQRLQVVQTLSTQAGIRQMMHVEPFRSSTVAAPMTVAFQRFQANLLPVRRLVMRRETRSPSSTFAHPASLRDLPRTLDLRCAIRVLDDDLRSLAACDAPVLDVLAWPCWLGVHRVQAFQASRTTEPERGRTTPTDRVGVVLPVRRRRRGLSTSGFNLPDTPLPQLVAASRPGLQLYRSQGDLAARRRTGFSRSGRSPCPLPQLPRSFSLFGRGLLMALASRPLPGER